MQRGNLLMAYKLFFFIALALLGSCDALSEIKVDLTELANEGITQNPVAILQNGGGFCVATLENGQVLTAGHCITSTHFPSRMKLRFQNPNNENFKVVSVKNIFKKAIATENEQLHPITRENIHTTTDFALLEVENPEELKKEFSSFPLSNSEEMEQAYLSDSYKRPEGRIWVYKKIDEKNYALKKQRGNLDILEASLPNYFQTFKTLKIIDTVITGSNSGAPFVYKNKVMGVVVRADSSTNYPGTNESRHAYMTQSLFIK